MDDALTGYEDVTASTIRAALQRASLRSGVTVDRLDISECAYIISVALHEAEQRGREAEQRGREAERARLRDACEDAIIAAVQARNAGELLSVSEIIGRAFDVFRDHLPRGEG